MRLDRLWLQDFRNYPEAELPLSPGLTVLTGGNGQGKTNLLEAIGYLATLSSFRGAPTDALVRQGSDHAVIRAHGMQRHAGGDEADGRELLIEAELLRNGRNRTQVNRQPLRRARDLLGTLRITVFSPDDLILLKGGPGERRTYLDAVLVALTRKNDELRLEIEKILKQRNALLRSAGGRLRGDMELTLDVWDQKFSDAGTRLGLARANLVQRLEPLVGDAYRQVAGTAAAVTLEYTPPWLASGLGEALAVARKDDLRRSTTTVGPHRDELVCLLNEMPARTHASQGEQRSLALALRLAGHRLVTDTIGEAPVLLLDDVFSELDDARSEALVAALPPGQALLSTAAAIPNAVESDAIVTVRAGSLTT